MATEHISKHTVTLARFILGCSVFVALIASFFLSWNLPGIQIPITVALVVTVIVLLYWQSKRTPSHFQIALLTTAVASSAFVGVRSSEVLFVLNIGLTLFVLAVCALEMSWQRPLKLIEYLVHTWLVPLMSFPAMDTLTRSLQLKLTRSLTHTQKSVARGIIFAIPVLIVFGTLFASADVVFANIFKQLFSFDLSISEELVGRSFFALVIFSVLAPILSYMFLKNSPLLQYEHQKLQSKFAIELAVVLGSLNMLFLLFVFIQGVYLFGSTDFVLNGDITYAEYGRRGFFELLAVSVLVFSLAFGVKRLFNLSKNNVPKILLIVLIVQVGFIIISAFRRLGLYVDVFGLTELRFYSHSFIFFLIAAFILLVYTIQANKPESMLLKLLVVTFSGYIILLNVVNPDATIAQRNLSRFERTGKIDANYMSSLSHDAIDQKVALFTQPEPDLDQFESSWYYRLCHERDRLNERAHEESWSTTNASRKHARSVLSSFDCSS